MTDKLYKKVGNRYKEVGHEFKGFPCNGIWLVADGRQSCIIQLSEFDTLPMKSLIFRINHADKCTDYIAQKAKQASQYSSIQDVANWACDYFSETALEQQLKGEK